MNYLVVALLMIVLTVYATRLTHHANLGHPRRPSRRWPGL